MAHYKSSRPEKAPKLKKVRCSSCGDPGNPGQMVRYPPERGPWMHKKCRNEKKAADAT